MHHSPSADPGRHLTAFVADEAGSTAIEYGLVLSLIFLAILGAVSLMADQTTQMWTLVADHIAA